MKKRYVFVIAAVAAMLLASGCSGFQSSGSESGKVTLKLFHRWPKEPEKSFFEEAVKEYEDSHPGVSIQTEAVLNDSYKDKIKVMLGTSQPPDIYFAWSDEFARKIIKGDRALDLTSYYKEDQKWSGQLLQSQIEPFSAGGKTYGVPWQMASKEFFYNKDIFKKLNLSPPKTWDELIRASKVLKENGYMPIAFGAKATWAISHYIGTLNQRLVDAKTRETDYHTENASFTDQGYVDALAKLQELLPYFTKHVNSVDHEYVRQQFKSGKAGMIYAETSEIKLVNGSVNLGLFSFPDISGQKGSSDMLAGAPEGFMISSKTKHPKEAMAFLKFLTSKKMGEKLVKDVGKFSPVKGTANKDNADANQLEAVDSLNKAKGMVAWFDMDVDAEIADAYLTNVQKMLGGDMRPEEVMKEVQKAAKSK
ncbi:ABC transporter substrate-binding protein [Bacillus glycinifermentans]|uniref:Extracellular solute-binding protein n=1 Tax=Bacillus glycinifermentans TaxID=1664069 RepID=A0A0T6BRW9_9BACI|nr:extracellular solute-binding protein [Bacillus glycinifermentans]ATH93040.1 sugar ABC transporter substrate-binding protein [Bacillus glycinifermentans]KRT94284.1 sugar ABC transporter substrate-binding protein [Bacillus glycinifermentans]MEC0485807.1 extracellular solute-binding protein [Bacillus glycinifermentans]